MLTPRFELSQDDEFIILEVYAPYTSVADTEFTTVDNVVIFCSQPYHLKLSLPKNVLDDDRNKATYDADKGKYTAMFVKENKGEVFEGLDRLTLLSSPPEAKWKTQLNPSLVEEITSSESDTCLEKEVLTAAGEQGNENIDEVETDQNDWCLDQIYQSESDGLIFGGAKYGFANKRSDMSQKLMLEFSEIFDVTDLDSASCSKRREDRVSHEAAKFDEEHYLADLFDNEETGLLDILNFEPWWNNVDAGCVLSSEEKDVKLNLPSKNYLLDKKELSTVFFGLVDIVFAYAYNHRTVYGENTVESAWTIVKLAATLSWLDSYESIKDVVVSSCRRALTFPLFRNWDLCVKVLDDIRLLFAGGKRALLKCLLDVHSTMTTSEPSRSVLNDLYITDYCVWVQKTNSKHIQHVAEVLKQVKLSKTDVGLELDELEFEAMLMLKEQERAAEVNEIAASVEGIALDSPLDSEDESDGGKRERRRQKKVDEDNENEEGTDDSEEGSEEESDTSDSDEESDEDSKHGKSETAKKANYKDNKNVKEKIP